MKNNKKGYSVILCISLIPIILTLILSLCSIYLFSYDLTKYRKLCLQTGIKIQTKLLATENKLLYLNPNIKKLRLEKNRKKIQLNAAIIAGNEILALKIQEEIYLIERQLQLIDFEQKEILADSKNETTKNIISLYEELILHSTNQSANWSNLINIHSNTYIRKWPNIGLLPDNQEIAPVYEFSDQYEALHNMALFSQTKYLLSEDIQKFLNSKIDFKPVCETSLKKVGEKWKIIVNVDKF